MHHSCVLTGPECRRSSLRLPLTSHMAGMDKGPSPMPSARRGMRSHRQALSVEPPTQSLTLSSCPVLGIAGWRQVSCPDNHIPIFLAALLLLSCSFARDT